MAKCQTLPIPISVSSLHLDVESFSLFIYLPLSLLPPISLSVARMLERPLFVRLSFPPFHSPLSPPFFSLAPHLPIHETSKLLHAGTTPICLSIFVPMPDLPPPQYWTTRYICYIMRTTATSATVADVRSPCKGSALKRCVYIRCKTAERTHSLPVSDVLFKFKLNVPGQTFKAYVLNCELSRRNVRFL